LGVEKTLFSTTKYLNIDDGKEEFDDEVGEFENEKFLLR